MYLAVTRVALSIHKVPYMYSHKGGSMKAYLEICVAPVD